MRAATAFVGGVIAATVMSALMALGRGLGLELPLELLLGAMWTGHTTGSTWLLGLGIHLVFSGLVGVAYGLVFEFVTHRAGWAVGLFVGLLHTALAGLATALVPWIHPLVPGTLAPPGAFLAHHGPLEVVAFVLIHLVFGAVVGEVYGPVRVVRDWRAAA